MKDFDIFCDAIGNKLEDVKREIQTKGLTDASLEYLHKLSDTKKNLMKIEKLEMEMSGGMMNDMGGNSFRQGQSNNSYRQMGNSYQQGGGNSNGYSNAPMYYGNSYNGYSMDGNSGSYGYLEEAMRHAQSEAERDAIRQVMTKLYK